VTLVVNGETYRQPLEVRKDPNSAGSEAEIAEQVRLLNTIRADLNTGAEAVWRIETIRRDVQSARTVHRDQAFTRAADALETKLMPLAMELVDLRLTGGGQDGVRFEAKLLQKFGYLAGALGTADFRPTDQQAEVQTLLHAQLQQHLGTLDQIVARELEAVNRLLRARNAAPIAGAARVVP
jgi:hypothetical protein